MDSNFPFSVEARSRSGARPEDALISNHETLRASLFGSNDLNDDEKHNGNFPRIDPRGLPKIVEGPVISSFVSTQQKSQRAVPQGNTNDEMTRKLSVTSSQ